MSNLQVGGDAEYKICEGIRSGKITKPVVAWCIGKLTEVTLRLFINLIFFFIIFYILSFYKLFYHSSNCIFILGLRSL